ncbi:MAG: alpha/beta hydrolase [Chloroflexota bacterium]
MTAWMAGDVVANGVRLHYHRTGGARPPLVLAHGITDNGLCWTPIARALEADYDVIMYDARGHGESEAPRQGFTWEDLAADLAGLIEALRLEQPRVLGHSLGAATAARVAAGWPGLVCRVALEDPPWRLASQTPQQRAEHAETWRNEVLSHHSRTPEELLAFVRQRSPNWPEDELPPWVIAKHQVHPIAIQVVHSDLGDWRETARRIACPALLITADPERGAIVTPEDAADAVRLMPQGHLVRIADAGHNIRRENRAAYLAAVRPFLAGV